MRAWGLRAAAITDHDTLDGYRELRAAGLGGREARPGSGPGLVTGIEINAVAGVEADPADPREERHILGYGLDPDAPALAAVLVRQQALRRSRIEETVARLGELGMPVDEPLQATLGPAVTSAGRPHVARALVAAGYAASVDDAFARHLGRGRPGYVPRRGLGTREAIEAVHGAGGIPVLAHTVDADQREQEVQRLQDWGLMGLEVYYGGLGRPFTPTEVRRLADLAARRGLLATGGSDYHGDTMSYAEAQASTWVPEAAARALLDFLGVA